MPGGCSIRALWILNSFDTVVFSRRFPVVEKRWKAACKIEDISSSVEDPVECALVRILPNDSELAAAFAERKRREGSTRGFGIRVAQSTQGSDSWVDDPITRHVISLRIGAEEEEDKKLLWPLILHLKGPYTMLVLPLVEPKHLKAYGKMSTNPGCGDAVGEEASLSTLLLDLPSITGYEPLWWHMLLVTLLPVIWWNLRWSLVQLLLWEDCWIH